MESHPNITAHCNDCGGQRQHAVLKKERRSWISDEAPSFWNTYAIIECCGCNSVSYRTTKANDQETDPDGDPTNKVEQYPPATYRLKPEWFYSLDQKLPYVRLIREVYTSLQNNAPASAAMGIRAAIDSIAIDKIGDIGGFDQKLKKLKDDHIISADQHTVLETALEVGHASIHRNYFPTEEQLKMALEVTEALILGLYVLPGVAAAAKAGIPTKPSKPAKAPATK